MPTLTNGDVNLYYEVSGEGPPVVLIQGVGIAGRGWKPQIEALSRRYQVLAFDNRGIGRSSQPNAKLTVAAMANDVLALMDHAGWRSAHLVGHSMGGIIAHQAALDAPDRIASLALLCTWARGKDAAKLRMSTLVYGLRMSVGTRVMRRRAALELVTPMDVIERRGEEACARELEEAFGRSLIEQPRFAFQQLRAMASHDEMRRLSSLGHIPTLVVSAGLDQVTLPRYGKQLSELVSGARYVELPECGHAVTVHQADEVNRLLLDHLDGVGTQV